MARRIPPEKVQEIYDTVRIMDIVQDYVQLKRRGSNYFGLSPFTNERTPSFSVSPVKNIFKDFSTGKGGNAITFLMEVAGLTYTEALLSVAERYGIQIDLQETPEEAGVRDLSQSILVLNEFAAQYYQAQLQESQEGRIGGLGYLKERGLLYTTIKDFQLGYSPENGDAFTLEALRNQFTEEILTESGLTRKDDQGRWHDMFRGRVIFPILNHAGRAVGFGGRILKDMPNAPKYINSRESAAYNKSNVLYGLFQARKEIQKQDRIILTEGYMDVISFHQYGVPVAVASSGTSLTEQQVALMRRYTRNVIIIYDGDKAGINASLRAINLLLHGGMNIQLLLLPDNHDPDSYLRTFGHQAFEDYLNNHRQDFIQYTWHCLKDRKADESISSVADIARTIAASIALIEDPIQQNLYIQEASRITGVAEQAFTAAVKLESIQIAKQQKREQPEPVVQSYDQAVSEAERVVRSSTYHSERELLRFLLNFAEYTVTFNDHTLTYADIYLNTDIIPEFTHELLSGLRQQFLERYKSTGRSDYHALLVTDDDKVSGLVSSLVMLPEELSPNWNRVTPLVEKMDTNPERSFFSATRHFRFNLLKSHLEGLRKQLQAFEMAGESDKVTVLLEDIQLFNETKTTLAKELGIVVHE